MNRTDEIQRTLASLRAGLYVQRRQPGAELRHAPPFVTISRQAGAGGRTLARALTARLAERGAGEPPWAVWDRELVEKVAREQHLPVELIESLEGAGPRRTLFGEFLASLAAVSDPADLDEYQVYRRVAYAARGIARTGWAVIVGCGGVYATADLAGGVHVRLVAPLQDRVRHMAEILKVPEDKAADEVRRTDRHRDAFHRRYWGDNALMPEIFSVSLNTSLMTEDQMVRCLLQLLPEEVPARAATHPSECPVA